MTVAFIDAPPIQFGQPPEPLDLKELGDPLELREVILDPRVRQVGSTSTRNDSTADRSSLISGPRTYVRFYAQDQRLSVTMLTLGGDSPRKVVIQAVKAEFLILYDYRKGGVWAYLRAESAEQIERVFPELKVVTETPAWLTEDEERHLRARMTIDIDDTDNLLLASLMKNRRTGG